MSVDSSLLPPSIPDLPSSLEALLQQIPLGQVTTYGDLAEALGDRAAARWVGEYLLHHRHTEACVCHRVVRRSGEVGRYISGFPEEKIARLRSEGIEMTDGHIDLRRFGFHEFRSSRPLQSLRHLQNRLTERFVAEPLNEIPSTVGGVDLAYQKEQATAALVVVETETGRQIAAYRHQQPIDFPYLPGYLSFRELPALLALLRKAATKLTLPQLIFVDGNGLLHPRGAGIATHLGVVTGLRTIGVGKKLLCGRVNLNALSPEEPQPVRNEGKVIGAAVQATLPSRPVYVSPGHRIATEDAVALTRRLFFGHRLPEPIYLADRLSRQQD